MPSATKVFTGYRVLSRSYFHLSILFVFFHDRGFSLPTVELTLAVYGAALAFSGSVTKPLAARLSLTAAVAAGEWLKALGLVLLALPGGLPMAVAGQIVAALGFSLASGTDSALLAEICKRDGADARTWEARSGSLTFAAALVAGVLGAIVYQWSHQAPFVLSAVMSALAALTVPIVGRGLTGAPKKSRDPALADEEAPHRKDPRYSAALRWSAYYTVVRAFVLALFIGFLPYLLYLRLHVSLPLFGVVLGSYTLSGYFTARNGRRAVDRFGARATAAACAALAGAGLLILLWQPNTPGAAVATLALGAGVGAVRPVAVGAIGELLADRPAAERAAALRANEARFAVVNTLLILLAGLLLDRVGFPHVLLGVVVGYLVLAAAAVLALPRATDPEPAAEPATAS
ncbi:MFS transporter [Streptomyces sp. NBC_01622]|uniref:MFS transporter n=1 Tax=Streptomyces sp. NBC_01622 TaxID=2975903 RepID=UPI00386348FF|nr:MFS transporter [Streptomyces sp. NBC_01622]